MSTLALLETIVDEVTSRGPTAVADIQNKGERYGYWGTSTAKLVLETLTFQGELAVSDRVNTARRYDLFDHAVPAETASKSPFLKAEAHREMMKLALGSIGIGTIADCADYYRIKRNDAAKAIRHLVEMGEIEEVKVDGVRREMFAVPGIKVPDVCSNVCTIVSPFDPVAWFRDRLEWLFNFEYRIEIYTPVKKRKYGY